MPQVPVAFNWRVGALGDTPPPEGPRTRWPEAGRACRQATGRREHTIAAKPGNMGTRILLVGGPHCHSTIIRPAKNMP
jgi:hypothetical protein